MIFRLNLTLPDYQLIFYQGFYNFAKKFESPFNNLTKITFQMKS